MKKLIFCLAALIISLGASAQNESKAKPFLDKMEKFVVSVEKTDTISEEKWKELNADYKLLRTEYREKYMENISNEDLQRYTSLKTRYVKQVAQKKVGRDIKKQAQKLGHSIQGIADGIMK